ncbi:protein translocase subunit SecD [Haliovirga abyssi]|uniref:Protein translocase subunit SecD n=1 Tax=Haliovirga abyssi TaxID=2996794 RepID=A0AAU9DZ53_9FUSO|nr:protein translocase subunit SecD [Haliovirga abyssi]BDU50780.1 protein translocase subunit SecD [Haliovirga abyssi]
MKKSLLVNLALIAVVLGLAVWFAFLKPVRLGLDLKGGVYVVLEAQDTKEAKVDNQAMDRLVEVLDRRVNGLGVSEPVIQRSGDRRVIVELPGVKDTEEAIKVIGKTALLEFRLLKSDGSLGDVLLTGKELKKADVSFDRLGRPQIGFELTTKGAKIFADITKKNIGKQLAITLDGAQQTAPTIQSEIPGGKGVITGSYTVDEAKKMATLLNAGALPVKVKMLETRTVGATLGEESIQASYKAGIVALILIAIFMVVWYRLPGLIADLALLIFGIIAFGTLNFIDSTLTLPGIAGFILSVGMAVDANVIIFERLKEELRLGNSILAALDAGFKKAFMAIFDSNITTLIITAILFALGTGPVKGFAVTLTIGILASMFTAIVVTRVLLKGFIYLFKIENPILFGVRR